MLLLLQEYEVFVSVDECSYSCKDMKCLSVLMNAATLARNMKCLSVLMNAATLARIWSVCQCWWMQLLLQEYEVFVSVDECCYSCKGTKCLSVLMNDLQGYEVFVSVDECSYSCKGRSVCQCWWMQLLLQGYEVFVSVDECCYSCKGTKCLSVLMNEATLARIWSVWVLMNARVEVFGSVDECTATFDSVDECSYLARVWSFEQCWWMLLLLQE